MEFLMDFKEADYHSIILTPCPNSRGDNASNYLYSSFEYQSFPAVLYKESWCCWLVGFSFKGLEDSVLRAWKMRSYLEHLIMIDYCL